VKSYTREFVHYAKEAGVKDERFLERFLETYGDDLERELGRQAAEGLEAYEAELDFWLRDKLMKDYETYKSLWQAHVSSGEISPKKGRASPRRSGISGIWERQEAFARYLQGVASEDGEVIRFRERILLGRLLSGEEALIFLSSPLAAAKAHADFKLLRVNALEALLDTEYHLEDKQDDSGPYKKLIKGHRSSYTLRPLGVVATRQIFPGDVVTYDDLRGLRLREDRAVIFPHPREEGRLVLARPGSVIGNAAGIVEDRLKGYPLSLEMGVWFILTGEFIPQDPVRMSYLTHRRPTAFSRTTLTLELESWVPPEEVAKQYRHAQSELLGRTPRSLKARTLAVFEFVNQNSGRDWAELFKVWNKEHPRWRFKDPRHLNTTYTRAFEHIASPDRIP
jgi:hypothetical protein